DLQKNKCFQKVATDGFKCVDAIDSNFDATKLDTDVGIKDITERCCALSVMYDCFVSTGKKSCTASGDDYKQMIGYLDTLKEEENKGECKEHPYKAGQTKCK
ncbi:unnamed protein product, partial [Oppiella nova]